MTPVNYLGIAAIIGGGYFAVSNLRTLYSMGCHVPAGMLLGSVGVVYLGFYLKNKAPESSEESEE
jgi:hypothetical protein|tara:strand:- start:183 stop:377 length:195 start_codon:yes stop_codon:yes gene_type:complete